MHRLVRGGGGGIRTHGTLAGLGLANQCHWPLGDASMAVGVGFEPTVPRERDRSFQDFRTSPLCDPTQTILGFR